MAFVDYVVACFREHRLLTAEVSRLEARIAELEATLASVCESAKYGGAIDETLRDPLMRIIYDKARRVLRSKEADDAELKGRGVDITIDRRTYPTNGGKYTGLAIKQLGGIPREHRLFLETSDSEDLQVLDEDRIELADSQTFYSMPAYINAG